MEMTIIFKDGSHPYVMNGCKQDIMREYLWFDRVFGDNITVEFYDNGLKCVKCSGIASWAISPYFDGAHHTDYYQRLGDALNRLKNSEF